MLPCRQRLAGVLERREQRFVQRFIPQPPVEALDNGVLGWLAVCEVGQNNAALSRSLQDRQDAELRAVVGVDNDKRPLLIAG